MSRIGKKPVTLPKGVAVEIQGNTVAVKGPKGELRRVSTPGLRRYVKCRELPRVRNGLGMAIVSTPKGLMSDRDARSAQVGGELLAVVW